MKASNKIALVTGGTTGIGLATAKRLRDEGATVIVTGVDKTRLADAAKELGDSVTVVKADFRKPAELDALFKNIEKNHGRIDMLFANAGVGTVAPLESVTTDDVDRLFDINFKGAFFAVQKSVPLMGKGGSIVLTTSFLNAVGVPGFSVLSASKSAVRSLARTLGAELASRNIRVNAVSPGPISTPFHSKLGLTDQQLNAAASDIEAQVPLGRFGEADEVARAAVFLASDEASFITGTEVVVDGGLSQF
jgi:NAD(P)-dependent dehydrogenase (short-subunit alcohol dehydrogenase family)